MDLRLLFDTILEVGKDEVVNEKIKELQLKIYNSENLCGSCKHWMNPQCKREIKQRVRMNEIKCNDFEIDYLSNKLLSKYKIELNKLLKPVELIP
jgi:hypothetical protein